MLAGCALVVLPGTVTVKWVAIRRISAGCTPEIAEGKAVCFALRLAKILMIFYFLILSFI